MPTTEEYYQWKLATFGNNYDIWHDGLNIAAVQSLTGESREKALSMLHKGVELNDSHAAEALAAMAEVNALPDLHTQLDQSSGEDKVRVALAINNMSPDESLSKNLIDTLEDGSLHWGARISAAVGLRDFSDKTSESALLKAVEHDRNYLVRYNASNSLIKRWGATPSDISEYSDIRDLIGLPWDGPINAEEQERLSMAIVCLQSLREEEE